MFVLDNLCRATNYDHRRASYASACTHTSDVAIYGEHRIGYSNFRTCSWKVTSILRETTYHEIVYALIPETIEEVSISTLHDEKRRSISG